MVPYFCRANRGVDDMAVWLPVKFLNAAVSFGGSGSAAEACIDAREPRRSSDTSVPRVTWWDHTGTTEWIDRRFELPREVSSARVYWFDDTGFGGCRVPASWRLLYKDCGEWKPVLASGKYGVCRDEWNDVSFVPVSTTSLRLEVSLQEKYSGGVLSWQLK